MMRLRSRNSRGLLWPRWEWKAFLCTNDSQEHWRFWGEFFSAH